MESLKENRPLLYSILFSASAVFILAGRIMPEFSDQFQIVQFEDEVLLNYFRYLSLILLYLILFSF